MRSPLGVLLLLASLLVASSAIAEPSKVVVLLPVPTDPALQEAATRLEAELAVAGFSVTVAEATRDPGTDLRAELDRAVQTSGAFAGVALLPVRGRSAADVWVVDRATGKTVIRTVEVKPRPGESAPAALAIRAVELMRASLLEATDPEPAARAEVRQPLPPDVSRWVAPRPSPLEGPALGAGLAGLISLDGVGAALGPVLRLSYGLRSGFAARATFAGPALGPDLEARLGEVSVRQELGALELVFARELGSSRLAPFASLGGGAYHLHAVGAVAAPYRGRSDGAWAAFIELGLGLGVRLDERWMVAAQGSAAFSEPRVVLRAGPEVLGRTGRPLIITGLELIARVGR